MVDRTTEQVQSNRDKGILFLVVTLFGYWNQYKFAITAGGNTV